MKKTFKIALIGSHSCGKTTLTNTLSAKLKIPTKIKDIAEELCLNRFHKKSPLDLTLEEFWEMEILFFSTQLQGLTSGKSFISDGGFILDPLYLQIVHNLTEKNPALKAFKKICLELTKHYTHLIYLPPEIPHKDKSAEESFRKKVDSTLLGELKKNKLEYYTVTGNLEERVDKIKKIIISS